MKEIVIIGGGGHAKSCIDVISHHKDYSILGINDPKLSTSSYPSIPLLKGSLEDIFSKNEIILYVNRYCALLKLDKEYKEKSQDVANNLINIEQINN